jgi:SAM-dependent methyltransferase
MTKDLFSLQASSYAKYRPTYPAELYEHILSLVRARETAWDCATGNGQAALALALHFNKVYATDLSAEQIRNATPHSKVEYSVAPCDRTPFSDHSFDLITVAQAYHWFDFDAFAREVGRVAKPEGILAIWGYHLGQCEDPAVQKLVEKFYDQTVGPYWDPERKYVEECYETIPFPYPQLSSRRFSIPLEWSREDLLGYLNTWSGVQHYIQARGTNPVEALAAELAPIWKGEGKKHFHIPLFLRVGRAGRKSPG